jgi:hypothetical protein
MTDSLDKDFFRHTLATLAYRGSKATRGAPAGFSEFRAAPGSRSAGEILAHIGDLLDWALIMAKEKHLWREAPVQSWDADVERFVNGVSALDAYLAGDAPLQAPLYKLFQGPIADALTHVGQISMLRRLAGTPVPGENFFRADIKIS